MRVSIKFSLIIFTLIGLLACNDKTQVEIANKENILLFGNGGEPKGLDPHRVSGVPESNILRSIFEGLLQDHPEKDISYVGGAAESWEHNSDKTIWTFKLRKNGKWSDGTPLTAHDFEFAYHRMLRPETGSPFVEMLYFLKNSKSYNQTKLGKILCGLNPEFPVKWKKIESTDFSPNSGSNNNLNQIGLDHLKLEKLKEIKTSPQIFNWPENISNDTKIAILDELIEYHSHKTTPDLWERAKVGVTVIDDYTLQLELRGPTTFLPQLTKHFTWYPVPRHLIMKLGDGDMSKYFTEWTNPKNIVGNGPFKLKSWRMNHSIETERNPHYWDKENVTLNGVRFLPINNVYKQPQILRQEPYVGCNFYRFNINREALSDIRVRQALNLAINKEEITARILRGYVPATGITPPMTNYDPPKVIDYNIQKAQKLLAEAGYPDGKGFPRIKILINTKEKSRTLAEAIQASFLKNLNITVEIVNMEWAAYLATVRSKDYDIARGSWIGDYLDPLTFLELWTSGNSNNNTGFANKEFDQILERAGQEVDEQKRAQLLIKAERLFLEQNAILPIAWYYRNYLVHTSVK